VTLVCYYFGIIPTVASTPPSGPPEARRAFC
jgi:hypothetical protein